MTIRTWDIGKKLTAIAVAGVMLLAAGCERQPETARPSPTAGQSGQQTPEATDYIITASASPAPTATTAPTPPPAPESEETLVRVADYIPDILVELKYATVENFTGGIIYDYSEAYLRWGTVKKLAEAQNALAEQGFNMKIWDAYRTVAAQHVLWEACPDPVFVANPNTGSSSHNRGNTVDVTLVGADGVEAELPTGFDDFSASADRDYSDVSASAAANAGTLEKAMTAAGFSGYSAEWWHFSDTQSYEVLTDFPEGFGESFVVSCEEYISLRAEPNLYSAVVCTIAAGEKAELLGYTGELARLRYMGKTGWALAEYLVPEDKSGLPAPDAAYGYETMLRDIEALCAAYPDSVSLETVGTSEEGREIPAVIFGDMSAQRHVLVQGAMHAREYVTAWLMLRQLEYLLENGGARFQNATAKEALEGVCFHLIPMSNPDGVELSVSRSLNAGQRDIFTSDTENGYTDDKAADYAAQWKANALGVDLNRNFDAGWAAMRLREAPSSEAYKGTAPLCAAESAALAKYTQKYDFAATVSYHASGGVVFYNYGTDREVIESSFGLAGAVASVTGYGLPESAEDEVELDAGGYKDWVMSALGIASVTVEVGGGDSPLEAREYYTIFLRNRFVFPAVAQWVKNNSQVRQ